VTKHAVQDGVVDRGADVVAEGTAPERRRVVDVAGLRARLRDELAGPGVDVQEGGADGRAAAQGLQDVRDQGAGVPRAVDLGRGQDLDHRMIVPAKQYRSSNTGQVIPGK